MKNIKFSSVLHVILTFLLLIFEDNASVLAQISWHNTCGAKYLHVEETNRYAEWAAVPDTIIIPVVFHILTQGGVENISKAQVLQVLQILNEDFNNKNADTLAIPLPFCNVRGNPKIEFRLARRDPNGNCTDGIDRIYTPYTYGPGGTGNHFNLQKYFDWDHKRYMNIYVVNWIEFPNEFNISGAAYIPPVESVASHPEFNDAITICYNALGAGFNGLPLFLGGRTLTHEMGHFVGMLHTWGETDDCEDDDLVADTPKQADANYYCPVYPQISCSDSPHGDMFNNFMDYADCRNMYSQGQVDRMRSCLGLHPWRKEQWTNENLITTGVKDILAPCNIAPVADFGYGNTANWLGAGYPISFNEASSWDPDSFLWEFEGGIPSFSTEKFPKVIFRDTGLHNVTLRVSGIYGSDTISKPIYIAPEEISYDGSMTETFENVTEANNLVKYNKRGTSWAVTDKAAKSGSKSFYNPGNSQYVSGFFTHIFNVGNASVSARQLTFDVALGMSSSVSAVAGMRILWKRPMDFDRWELEAAYSSTITSRTLHVGDVLTPESLNTAITNTAFIPTASQWKTVTLPIPDTLTGEIQIGFLWANFLPTTKFKGLYIDNIRITNTTGVNDAEASRPFLAFPNPTSDYFSLDIQTDIRLSNADLRMYDLYGRLVMNKKGLEIQEAQDISSFTNGIYIIELKENGRTFRSKLLISK